MARVKITNIHNTVLIDDSYVNLCLAAKGTVVLTRISSLVGYRADITYTSAEELYPMLAVSCLDAVCIESMQRTGNTYRWTVISEKAAVGPTLQYYIFHVPASLNVGQGLLMLRNAQNVITFNSNAKYLRVTEIVNTNLNTDTSKTYPAGRVYAVAFMRSAFVATRFFIFSGSRVTQVDLYRCYGTAINGNNVSHRGFTYYEYMTDNPTSGLPPYNYETLTGAVMIIDVTEY